MHLTDRGNLSTVSRFGPAPRCSGTVALGHRTCRQSDAGSGTSIVCRGRGDGGGAAAEAAASSSIIWVTFASRRSLAAGMVHASSRSSSAASVRSFATGTTALVHDGRRRQRSALRPLPAAGAERSGERRLRRGGEGAVTGGGGGAAPSAGCSGPSAPLEHSGAMAPAARKLPRRAAGQQQPPVITTGVPRSHPPLKSLARSPAAVGGTHMSHSSHDATLMRLRLSCAMTCMRLRRCRTARSLLVGGAAGALRAFHSLKTWPSLFVSLALVTLARSLSSARETEGG